MTNRSALEQTMESLRRLPDDANFDDVLYRVYVLHALDAGLCDVEEGRTISHEEVKRTVRQWMLERNIFAKPEIPQPIILDEKVEHYFANKAKTKDVELSSLVNDVLRCSIDIIELV